MEQIRRLAESNLPIVTAEFTFNQFQLELARWSKSNNSVLFGLRELKTQSKYSVGYIYYIINGDHAECNSLPYDLGLIKTSDNSDLLLLQQEREEKNHYLAFYVSPEYRGNNLGQLLYTLSLLILEVQGVRSISFIDDHTVRTPGVSFFTQHHKGKVHRIEVENMPLSYFTTIKCNLSDYQRGFLSQITSV